ncbi:hypothetical protein ACEWPM_015760 [Roseovarius sp. S4756]|uniref:hypothetical protein n=1 Tax=Roseovarius maritimus TaxID=3342637 RepID=UPI003729514F
MTPDNINTLIITLGVLAFAAMVLWASVRAARAMEEVDSFDRGYDCGLSDANRNQWTWSETNTPVGGSSVKKKGGQG